MDQFKQTRKKAVNGKMAKRLKFDSEDQQRTESTSTTIVDVNDDCLGEIFRLLNIKDLLNVRATTSRFKVSTEMAYLHNQRVTPMVVSNGKYLELSVDILKQFGHLIKKLCVNFKMDKFEVLMQAIVKYCGDNMLELEFDHAEEEWYFGLHRIGVRRIQRQLRDLRTKFPKMLSLTFEYNDWVGCPYSDDIIQAIPTLTAFSVNGIIFSHEDVLQFIALNSQLERLQFWVPNGFVTQSFIDKVDASLPQLKLLELNRVTIEGPLNSTVNATQFKNLRKLIFGRVSNAYSVTGLISLFGTEIQELKLFSENYFIANFVESVCRFKKLTKMTINLVKYVDMDFTVNSPDAFDTSIVSPNAIKDIISSNIHLRKIKVNWGHQLVDFHIHETKYRKIFEQKLNGSQWLVHVREWCENTQSMHVTFDIQK